MGDSAQRYRWFPWFIAAVLLIGIVARALPQLFGPESYLQHYASEDGYLMLTLARNLALGLGMSTAEGTLPSNGTQPLTTLVWSLGFLATGCDKNLGVLIALCLQFVAALCSAWMLYRIGCKLFAETPYGRATAALATACWASSQRTTYHVMNCLETGFYILSILALCNLLVGSASKPREVTPRRALALGLMLGVVVWTRIDAVFLIAAVCLSIWFFDQEGRVRPSRPRFLLGCITGAVPVVLISPWLIYNKLYFGSFTPQSGLSQSMGSSFGENIPHALQAWAEYVMVIIPLPRGTHDNPLVLGFFIAVLLFSCWVIWMGLRHHNPQVRRITFVGALFSFALFAYYGLTFGAAHFISRYLFPCSPFFALAGARLAFAAWQRSAVALQPRLALAAAVLVCGVIGFTQWRIYHKEKHHQHWSVVQFVRTLDDQVWVGAIQTGTLGYFHDRTLNLDGKVNPEALAARRSEGGIHAYILDSKIDYLIDWAGIASWSRIHSDVYDGKFEVLIEDEAKNLGVMRRIGVR